MRVNRVKLTVLAAALVLIALPFALQYSASASANSGKVYYHDGLKPAPAGGMTEITDGSTLQQLAEFATNLPIVVVEFDRRPAEPTLFDREKGYRVPNPNDPYANGYFSLYNSESGINRLTDDPVMTTNIRARLRGNSSISFAKSQYLVKFYNEDGTKNRQDILGMGPEWEWVLNISYVDKTLLRNHICLSLSNEIMGYAPENRFCEMFEISNGRYEYKGVYLVMENIKQGEWRIALTDYDSRFAESSYVLVRDRFEEDIIVLNTYATAKGLTPSVLIVKYPGKEQITDETIAFIENDISSFEKALYAEDDNEFLTYREYIDVPSFVDYFIINEFFMNYDAGYNSTYMYKDVKGKLKMGPVWDFDQGCDNNAPYVTELYSTAMHDGAWYKALLRDGEFVRMIVDRYAELRQGVLSEEYIEKYIDDTIAFLGKAVDRDWSRWQYNNYDKLYEDSRSGKVHPSLLSNVRNFSQDVDHLKYVMRQHGSWLDEHIDSLYQFSGIEPGQYHMPESAPAANAFLGEGHKSWISGSLAVLFLALFFISIFLVQRE